MHIVLEAIEHRWKDAKERGNDLSTDQKQQLKEMTGNCEEILNYLETLLEKYKSLGKRKAYLTRMRWLPMSLGPIRYRFIIRTTLLSALNCAIL
jgi:hypothetical protein